MVDVLGRVDPGFEAVAAAFEENFTDRGDVGAATCLYVDGLPVLDIWAGEARPGVPWAEDTLALVWSTTKGVVALIATILADRGLLDVNAPVALYWPEFAAAGKEHVTVRQVLCHGAGLPYFPDYEDVVTKDGPDGWDRVEEIVERLAAAPLVWPPDEQHGEHAITYGWLMGEITRRITGRTIGTFLRDEVADPLGLDLWIGLPEENLARVADLIAPPGAPRPDVQARLDQVFSRDSVSGKTFLVGRHGIDNLVTVANSATYRTAEVPASNGITDARSLARMYAALAGGGRLDGVELVSQEAIDRHRAVQFAGYDVVLCQDKRYALGYMLTDPGSPHRYGPNDRAFGHPGLGGSLAFADPENGVGFGYVMNQMARIGEPHEREEALVSAVYDALG